MNDVIYPMEPITASPDYEVLFSAGCLPKTVCDFVRAAADFTCTERCMCGTAVISALSYCLTGVYAFEGKKGHIEHPVIYGLNVAKPSARKSPVVSLVKKPFIDFTKEWNEKHKSEIYNAASVKKMLERKIALAEKSEETDPKELASMKIEHDSIQGDTFRRIVVDDITPEGLLLQMKKNGSLLMMSDEAGMLMNFAGRYSNSIPNLDLFLKAWNAESFYSDRATKDSVFLDSPYLSVSLACQPYIFKNMIRNPAFRGSGLIARFIYCFPDDDIGYRKYDKGTLPGEINDAFRKLVYKLLDNKFSHKGKPEVIGMDDETYEKYCEFYDRVIEPKMKTRYAFCQDWAGKLHGLTLRLAGIIHIVRSFDEGLDPLLPINIDDFGDALHLALFYADQAVYAYTFTEQSESQELEEYVVRKLISKNITKISLSELYNICRGRIQRAQDLNEVLVSLEQKGYLVSVTEKNEYNKNIKMIVCNPDIETAQI